MNLKNFEMLSILVNDCGDEILVSVVCCVNFELNMWFV